MNLPCLYSARQQSRAGQHRKTVNEFKVQLMKGSRIYCSARNVNTNKIACWSVILIAHIWLVNANKGYSACAGPKESEFYLASCGRIAGSHNRTAGFIPHKVPSTVDVASAVVTFGPKRDLPGPDCAASRHQQAQRFFGSVLCPEVKFKPGGHLGSHVDLRMLPAVSVRNIGPALSCGAEGKQRQNCKNQVFHNSAVVKLNVANISSTMYAAIGIWTAAPAYILAIPTLTRLHQLAPGWATWPAAAPGTTENQNRQNDSVLAGQLFSQFESCASIRIGFLDSQGSQTAKKIAVTFLVVTAVKKTAVTRMCFRLMQSYPYRPTNIGDTAKPSVTLSNNY
jgi:hypothetical protein